MSNSGFTSIIVENILPIHLQEVIFGSSDSAISKQISRLEDEGKIKKIAPRIYTGKIDEAPADIIRRNLMIILGHQYGGAVLSHRSAFEFKPTKTNHIFLTYTYTKNIEWPGITLRFLKGHGPVEGDNKLMGELYASGQARAFLENLQSSKRPGPDSKTLTLPEIEEKLERIIQIHGEKRINLIREEARQIAGLLDMETEFAKLNKIISALLTTHPSKILTSPLAQARAFETPYDADRIHLFENLFAALQQREFAGRPDKNVSGTSYRNFAFFEAYFSNYIEGTRFEVEEAREIIRTQKPIAARNEDSHDVLGTYKLVSSKKEMQITPQSPEELLQILQYRHRILLSARTDKNPGQFKDRNNYAGNTKFVDVSLVRGTLIQGFNFYQALTSPFARSIFLMFMISEVHPFLDGNGRIARTMMNAELTKGYESKIIIPNVYRDNYMGALRKLTRQSDPDPYIRMMERAHQFSGNVYDEDIDNMQTFLESCNAFLEHTDGKLKIIGR